jgi:hypothetical protein
MQKLIVTMGLLIALSACEDIQPIKDAPPGGYDAIRFLRPVSVRDHGINIINFSTGSVVVADHQSQSGPVYCGLVGINTAYGATPYCFGLEGDRTLILNPGDLLKEVRREIPADSIERFHMK